MGVACAVGLVLALAMGGGAGTGGAAPTTSVTAVTSVLPVASVTQDQPPEVPCPRAEVDPPRHRPVPPDPPPHGPGDREVGGPALASAGLVIPPDAPAPPGGRLSARSWLVADLDTGAVLGACGAHEYGIPASTLKLLLALTLLDELDPGQTVDIVREDLDIEPGSSAVGLLVGGRYPVETLWLGLLLNSGNDAANVLARLGGGAEGVVGTLAAMNALARQIGARQTHAATPSGLDGPGQFTSAYDLALIARPLFDHEVFRRYIATERVDIPAQPPEDPDGFEIQNNNRLLYHYEGALGGKTGYTDLARQSFVGAAARDGRRLVVTLLGAERQPVPSWQQGAALLDWGFSLPPGSAVGRLVTPADMAAPARVAELVGVAGPEGVASPQRPSRAVTSSQASGGGLAGVAALVLAAVLVAAVAVGGVLVGRYRVPGPRGRAGPGVGPGGSGQSGRRWG